MRVGLRTTDYVQSGITLEPEAGARVEIANEVNPATGVDHSRSQSDTALVIENFHAKPTRFRIFKLSMQALACEIYCSD